MTTLRIARWVEEIKIKYRSRTLNEHSKKIKATTLTRQPDGTYG
jgi:hypothetical protein